MSELAIKESPIKGMFIINLELYRDSRGWFKENYQKAKMEALGLPKFTPLQNNFSFNKDAGVTRGLHAEPWEKFISLANGKVYGAWVDLRAGDDFGKTFQIELTPEIAVFVPRGVANGYQTLEPNVTYTYLVNEHWSPEAKYLEVNLYDKDLSINWPTGRDKAIISEKDLKNPDLKNIRPIEF